MSTITLTARVREITAEHASSRGPLLPILHAVQEEFGFVDPAAVPVIADELNLAVAEVHGVVSFYRDFRTEPPGQVQVKVCRAEACRSVGSEALAAHAVDRCGTKPGGTAADGSVSLDDVFCLGNCALGPSVEIDGRVLGRVTPTRFDAALATAAGAGAR